MVIMDWYANYPIVHRVSNLSLPGVVSVLRLIFLNLGVPEGAVRSVKRFMEEYLGPGGSLDNDKFAKAMLAYKKMPCR